MCDSNVISGAPKEECVTMMAATNPPAHQKIQTFNGVTKQHLRSDVFSMKW